MLKKFYLIKSLAGDRRENSGIMGCNTMQMVLCMWLFLCAFMMIGCSDKRWDEIDRLNEKSYSLHYRQLDRSRQVAQSARYLAEATGYDAGEAEALNNLAFVSIAKMDFTTAWDLLDSVSVLTDNQVELLVADVQKMRLCQRESRNKDFYDCREQALRRLHRIAEEWPLEVPHLQRRMLYALSEFAIVSSAYYYYVGLEQKSIEALMEISPRDDNSEVSMERKGENDGVLFPVIPPLLIAESHASLYKDTAQLIAYYYNIGAGGILTGGEATDISQREFDYLMRCYRLAKRGGYVFWEANSLQALSEHLQSKEQRIRLIADNPSSIRLINEDDVKDSLLAGNLAERSLALFETYGDVYQTAGSFRTLAECYWGIGENVSAIDCLDRALHQDTLINQAPDLVASICERLCVAYSAIDDKPHSDYYRNRYLDLQDETRQDRYLEARASQLDHSLAQLNGMMVAVVIAIGVLLVFLFVLSWLRRRDRGPQVLQSLKVPLQEWQQRHQEYVDSLNEQYEEKKEQKAEHRLHLQAVKYRFIEHRARVGMVNSIIPLIDRMLHEIQLLKRDNPKESQTVRKERYDYIAELTDQINDYNQVLTKWIQLRQGELSLHIESFALQPLFDMVARSRRSFQLKGIRFEVAPTQDVVKADRILTLFMINTIADNARKFTNEGGVVKLSSKATDEYVEVSIEDSGEGMEAERLDHVFDTVSVDALQGDTHHGYGLRNCKGIIEKYKKTSRIFSACYLGAESEKGKGSRFFFRLPKGILRVLAAIVLLISGTDVGLAQSLYLEHADAYADSVYQCNVRGDYRQTLMYADSCMRELNRHYLSLKPNGTQLMVLADNGQIPAEIQWFRDSLSVDYDIALSIRNECAVAALALHEWDLYRYNNKAYTKLYKDMSADSQLDDYCRTMQKAEINKQVAVGMLLLLLLLIFPIYYFSYYRHRIYYRYCVERIRRINAVLLGDADSDEKLGQIESLMGNRFPSDLQAIVEKVKETLHASAQHDQEKLDSIELLADECRRMQMESERLHVANSILDNCLSTLKHETMYYPSRIRMLVDGADKQLDAISELALYYKELYLVLSSQALRQIEAVKIECRRVSLSEVLDERHFLHIPENIILLGDRDLLRQLFDTLQQLSGEKNIQVKCIPQEQHYVDISIHLPKKKFLESGQIFAPHIENVPILLCRQIVRDIGTATHRRRCGMTIVPEADGANLTVTLALA